MVKTVNAIKHPKKLEIRYYNLLNIYRGNIYKVFQDEINLHSFSDANTKEEQIREFDKKVAKEIAKSTAIAKIMNKQLYNYSNRTLVRSFKTSNFDVDLRKYYRGDKIMLEFLKDNSNDYIEKYGREISTWLKAEIRQNYLDGGSYTNLTKGIKERLSVDNNKAKLIARNESGTFTGVFNKKRADDLGVEKGIWRSVSDSRVRSSHARADGKEFDIDKGLLVDGVYTWPAMEIQCRCFLQYVIE